MENNYIFYLSVLKSHKPSSYLYILRSAELVPDKLTVGKTGQASCCPWSFSLREGLKSEKKHGKRDFATTTVTSAVLFCLFKFKKAKNLIKVAASEYKNLLIIILVNCDNISPKYIMQSVSHRPSHFQVSYPEWEIVREITIAECFPFLPVSPMYCWKRL